MFSLCMRGFLNPAVWGQVRAAQIRLGDRELTVNAAGERVSRLKEVDADWILRRLERWGRRVRAPCPHSSHPHWNAFPATMQPLFAPKITVNTYLVLFSEHVSAC